MDLRAAMLQEFDHESELTKSLLSVVPDSLLDFQPDGGLHSVRWNVSHLADIPSWMEMILMHDSFDVAPVGEPPHRTPELSDSEEVLRKFESNSATARSVITDFSLDTLEDPWSLLAGGQALLTHSRYMIYRMYMINHVAHHRGHLLVYLRTNGVETPSLYG